MQHNYSVIWHQICFCNGVKCLYGYDSDRSNVCHRCATKISGLSQIGTIECPLTDITHVTLDFMLIPSNGTFLDNYRNVNGLHIGLVNQSQIYEFDADGLKITRADRKSNTKWARGLPLNLMKKLNIFGLKNEMFDIIKYADNAIDSLINHRSHSKWKKADYNEDTNNCFDFALKFVSLLIHEIIKYTGLPNTHEQLVDMTRDKISFSELMIIPETKKLCRYLSLRKKLMQQDDSHLTFQMQ